MSVNYDRFLEWASDFFGEENLKLSGAEIKTHSPFADDQKYHLWMRPDGGRRGLSGGAYRCWYTDRHGSLISLVSQLSSLDYDEAEALICGTVSLRALEQQVHELLGQPVEEKFFPTLCEFPPDTYKINQLPTHSSYRKRAILYLETRKIPWGDLYVCIDGKYKNRIIIPYYDIYGQLVYWNARTLSANRETTRYMKPDQKDALQENVLFSSRWPRPGSKLYLTEGEFDAISLDLCQFPAAASGGKSVSDAQIEILRNYLPVLAFDTDEGKDRDSGSEALLETGKKLLGKGFTEIGFVRPPRGYKDWNKLLELKGPDMLRKYIQKFERQFVPDTVMRLN